MDPVPDPLGPTPKKFLEKSRPNTNFILQKKNQQERVENGTDWENKTNLLN